MLPSTSANTESSSPFEELLDHELVAVRRHSAQRGVELLLCRADEHALARRQAVGLDDAGHTGNRHRLRERHAGGAHHVLREPLRPLDLRRCRTRPEHRDTGAAELVGHTGDERRLGPDHDEAGRQRARQLEQALAVLGADGMAPSDGRDPGVPWGGVDLLDHRALRELPSKRMLPPAGADDEDSHAAKPTV